MFFSGKLYMVNYCVEAKSKPDHIDRLVSKRLKMRRIMLGLSQQELSEAVGVSIQQIQKYEKAVNRISSGKLYGFAKILKVSINYFFDLHINSDDSCEQFVSLDCLQHADNKLPYEKEVLALIRSFGEIKDAQVRKKVLALIKVVIQ